MTASQEQIRELATAAEQMAARLELAKEDAKAALDAVGAVGLNKQAFKLAMRLKEMDQVKAKSFIDTLDACRDALGIDAQLDLLDAIDEAERDDEVLEAVTSANGGAAIRKARGRARELN